MRLHDVTRPTLFALFVALAALAACGEDTGSTPAADASDSTADVVDAASDTGQMATDATDAGADGDDAGADAVDTSGGDPDTGAAPDTSEPDTTADTSEMMDTAPGQFLTCRDDPPADAPTPPPLPEYSGESCPQLESGKINEITSSGSTREFMLVVPDDYQDGEQLPIIFFWHWLGGDAESFYEKAEVQKAVNDQRFIAVLPEEKGDLQTKWPYSRIDTDSRLDEEITYFDDLLTCVAQQYGANRHCVSSVGVSAGALWTGQLVGRRSKYLSSFISLSGGVGAEDDGFRTIKKWHSPKRAIPGVVLWGGPEDFCAVNFEETSHNLEDALQDEGSFFIECIHNCKHAQPPMSAPQGQSKYAALWDFVFDHPGWLDAGTSPYKRSGLPSDMPDWCGIGKGSATIRSGECGGSQCR